MFTDKASIRNLYLSYFLKFRWKKNSDEVMLQRIFQMKLNMNKHMIFSRQFNFHKLYCVAIKEYETNIIRKTYWAVLFSAEDNFFSFFHYILFKQCRSICIAMRRCTLYIVQLCGFPKNYYFPNLFQWIRPLLEKRTPKNPCSVLFLFAAYVFDVFRQKNYFCLSDNKFS